MPVIKLTDENYKRELSRLSFQRNPVMIVASNSPFDAERLQRQYGRKASVVQVDPGKNPQIANKFRPHLRGGQTPTTGTSNPTVLLYKRGQVKGTLKGRASLAGIRERIENLRREF